MNQPIDLNKIEIMTHEQAVKTQAVECYLLGEMSDTQRSAFEAHYFECPSCFEQIETSHDFLRHARQVLRDEKTPEPARSGWMAGVVGDFRRPAMAFVSAMLLCAIGIGVYQNNVISGLKAPRLEMSYTLKGEAKGASGQVIAVPRSTMLILHVEFIRDPKFLSYQAQIVSDSGQLKYTLHLPANQMADSVDIAVPADSLDHGKYKLAVNGVTSDGQQSEAGSGSFELQFTN